MVTVPSQPQLVPLTKLSLAGFIALSDHTEHFLSVNYSSDPPSVQLDEQLQSQLDMYPGKLNSIIDSAPTAPSFVLNLVSFLEGVMVSPVDRRHLLVLFKQIANLPPESVKSVDKNFKQVTLQETDQGGRTHFVSIQLDSKIPTLVCDLPEQLLMPLNENWSCQDVLKHFRAIISQYQSLWDTLDEIDGTCWVIEPEPFTRESLHRRIVLKEDVSIIVTLDPTQPTSLPRCRFLGSARAIQSLQNLIDERGEEQWDASQSVVQNLADILELELPPKPTEDSEKITIECGVCYCYDMMDQIPEISCNNDSCKQLYHIGCLVEWFKGLPHVRQSFGTVFGECPYCSKPMHVQAVL